MKLEKIYTISGLLVVGASIFAHSIVLQSDVKFLEKEYKDSTSKISTIENRLNILNTQYKTFDTKVVNNKEELIMLRHEIEKTADVLRESTAETKKILIDYLSRK